MLVELTVEAIVIVHQHAAMTSIATQDVIDWLIDWLVNEENNSYIGV